jgi:ectoine hydroxylase-related dioxygenase (phytanoyl-CoA dioxygenase family)
MTLTADERAENRLSEESLVLALQSLRDCGYVVLESALPREWVEELRAAFDEELLRLTAGRQEAVGKAKGHYGVQAPMRPPFTDPLAIENPLALQILEAALGPKLFSYLPYGSNTAWPGSGYQHIHRDTGHLFPETPLVLPISLAVVNIPLVEFTIENGATEVWPGSHRIVDHDATERAQLEERAARLPSARLTMPAGSLVVRDMRCWHRGMPNQTDALRTMTAMVYFRHFHHLPDHAGAFQPMIPPAVRDTMSERVRQIYRFHVSPDR